MSQVKTRIAYRFENPETKHGMWYNSLGEYDPIIDTLCPNGLSRLMPMGFCADHQKDGKQWYSAGRSVENMRQWFSREDAVSLVEYGFTLFEFTVTEWQDKEHELLITRESICAQKSIPLEVVWGEA